jgi:hypothetical protein
VQEEETHVSELLQPGSDFVPEDGPVAHATETGEAICYTRTHTHTHTTQTSEPPHGAIQAAVTPEQSRDGPT